MKLYLVNGESIISEDMAKTEYLLQTFFSMGKKETNLMTRFIERRGQENFILDSGAFSLFNGVKKPHPKGKILGLSKVARVVDYYSSKLQIQERLGSDIVNALEEALDYEYQPIAIGIILKGEHLCKSMRGVKKKGIMTTAYLKGALKDEGLRNEFLSYTK